MTRQEDNVLAVQEFLVSFRKDLASWQQAAEELLVICCRECINTRYPEDHFIQLKDRIEDLITFTHIRERIKAIKCARADWLKDFKTFAGDNFNELVKPIDDFQTQIQKIIYNVEKYEAASWVNAQNTYESISRCPFGEKENSTLNALTFQKQVLQLFDWLFIGEIERMDLAEIEDGSMRRDGGYKTLPSFNTKERCGFPFEHIFIECKNYMKPDRDDLMQTFSYTLHFHESKLFVMPLSLLISRRNPGPESTAWKLRSLLFKRRIDQEERLIIFLDVDDLGKMLEYKLSEGDPSGVLRDKLQELNNYNIKYGA